MDKRDDDNRMLAELSNMAQVYLNHGRYEQALEILELVHAVEKRISSKNTNNTENIVSMDHFSDEKKRA